MKLKTEALLSLLYLPIGLSNITKANEEMLIASIVLQAVMLVSVYLLVGYIRKEVIRDVKEMLLESIEPLATATGSLFRSIKKEVIRKQVKTTKLKDAYLKI